VTVGGWRIRQRPRRNRNEEFYEALSLSFSPCPLPPFHPPRPFPFISPCLPRFIQRLSRARPKYRRTLPCPPIAADARPISLPTLAVMHYETRNDESAYVSHVMEIPLLIRALNDSATAGYITCIITLMDGRRGVRGRKGEEGGGKRPIFYFPVFFLFFVCSPPTRIIDRWRAIDEGPRRPDGNGRCSGL